MLGAEYSLAVPDGVWGRGLSVQPVLREWLTMGSARMGRSSPGILVSPCVQEQVLSLPCERDWV